MVQQTEQVVQARHPQTENRAKRLRAQAEPVVPLVQRVIAQTRLRVLAGKQVASADKVLSLFASHTRAIARHNGGAEVEFGRQVVLNEGEGGSVTPYPILVQPDEHGQAVAAVAHHWQVFARPPGWRATAECMPLTPRRS
jgi:IS5 family transposase